MGMGGVGWGVRPTAIKGSVEDSFPHALCPALCQGAGAVHTRLPPARTLGDVLARLLNQPAVVKFRGEPLDDGNETCQRGEVCRAGLSQAPVLHLLRQGQSRRWILSMSGLYGYDGRQYT